MFKGYSIPNRSWEEKKGRLSEWLGKAAQCGIDLADGPFIGHEPHLIGQVYRIDHTRVLQHQQMLHNIGFRQPEIGRKPRGVHAAIVEQFGDDGKTVLVVERPQTGSCHLNFFAIKAGWIFRAHQIVVTGYKDISAKDSGSHSFTNTVQIFFCKITPNHYFQ
jgi:hypothetical protein